MKIVDVKFTGSSPDLKNCPAPNKPEFAFIGRSNVGKSSLINMLTNRKSLAKISSTPGKTQLINHFLINEDWYLVDLPGFGYAKVSKKERNIATVCLFVQLKFRHTNFYIASAFTIVDSYLK